MATPKRIPPPPTAPTASPGDDAAAEAQRRIDELAQGAIDVDETDGYERGANGSPIRPARKQIDPLGFKGAKADSSGTLPRFDLHVG